MLAEQLHNPSYIDHEESLEGIDISVDEMESDGIKSWLQKFLPATLVIPDIQKERRDNILSKLKRSNLSSKLYAQSSLVRAKDLPLTL